MSATQENTARPREGRHILVRINSARVGDNMMNRNEKFKLVARISPGATISAPAYVYGDPNSTLQKKLPFIVEEENLRNLVLKIFAFQRRRVLGDKLVGLGQIAFDVLLGPDGSEIPAVHLIAPLGKKQGGRSSSLTKIMGEVSVSLEVGERTMFPELPDGNVYQPRPRPRQEGCGIGILGDLVRVALMVGALAAGN